MGLFFWRKKKLDDDVLEEVNGTPSPETDYEKYLEKRVQMLERSASKQWQWEEKEEKVWEKISFIEFQIRQLETWWFKAKIFPDG